MAKYVSRPEIPAFCSVRKFSPVLPYGKQLPFSRIGQQHCTS